MSNDDFPHLIQYRDPITGCHRSTVLCETHEAALLRGLHALRVGCMGCSAGGVSRCDRCQDMA